MVSAFHFLIGCYILTRCCLIQGHVHEDCLIQGKDMNCTKSSGQFLKNYEQSNVRSLFITYSDMTLLNKDDFHLFSNLTTISISNSTMSFPIHDDLFVRVQNLTDLCIVNTNINESIFKLFSNNTKIRKLKLNDNKIAEIRKKFFENLRRLEEINLSNNEIVYIEEKTFENFSSLKKLNLSNNRIGNSYDPTYVSLGSIMCAVCRPNNNERVCSNNDLNNCLINKGVDTLWWKSNSINIHLENNPICLAVFENSTYNFQKNTTSLTHEETYGQSVKSCKVYEYGYCYKHESRRMFLLEVCGVQSIFPSPIFQRKTFSTQSKSDASDRTKRSNDDESWDLERIMLNASFATLFVCGLGIVILAAVIGALATYMDLERNKKINARRSRKLKATSSRRDHPKNKIQDI